MAEGPSLGGGGIEARTLEESLRVFSEASRTDPRSVEAPTVQLKGHQCLDRPLSNRRAGLAIDAGWRFETERLAGIADYCAD
jgi:hypothetical protein